MCESKNESTSSKETLSKPSKWCEGKSKSKIEFLECKVVKDKVNIDSSMSNEYVSLPQTNEVDLINQIKFKVRN